MRFPTGNAFDAKSGCSRGQQHKHCTQREWCPDVPFKSRPLSVARRTETLSRAQHTPTAIPAQQTTQPTKQNGTQQRKPPMKRDEATAHRAPPEAAGRPAWQRMTRALPTRRRAQGRYTDPRAAAWITLRFAATERWWIALSKHQRGVRPAALSTGADMRRLDHKRRPPWWATSRLRLREGCCKEAPWLARGPNIPECLAHTARRPLLRYSCRYPTMRCSLANSNSSKPILRGPSIGTTGDESGAACLAPVWHGARTTWVDRSNYLIILASPGGFEPPYSP